METNLVVCFKRVLCEKVFFVGPKTIYTSRICTGKKKFLCTLNIVNPEPGHVTFQPIGRHECYILSGEAYKITKGTSALGYLKLTAELSQESPNAEFLNYTLGKEHRWDKISVSDSSCCYITEPVNESPARLVGALLYGTQLNILSQENKLLKSITLSPGRICEI